MGFGVEPDANQRAARERIESRARDSRRRFRWPHDGWDGRFNGWRDGWWDGRWHWWPDGDVRFRRAGAEQPARILPQRPHHSAWAADARQSAPRPHPRRSTATLITPVFTPAANIVLTLRSTGTDTVDGVSRHEASRSIALMTRGLAAGDEDAFREFHAAYFDRLSTQSSRRSPRGQEDESAGGPATNPSARAALCAAFRFGRGFLELA